MTDPLSYLRSLIQKSGSQTLAEARAHVIANRDEGTMCPCCGQLAKVYRRKLNASMALSLVWIYQYFEEEEAAHGSAEVARGSAEAEEAARGSAARGDVAAVRSDIWLHVPSYLIEHKVNANNDVGLLRHWGLLLPRGDERDDGGKHSGYYRITDRGRAFVRGEVDVEKYIYLYDQKLLPQPLGDRERTTIQEALGDKFNFRELMSGMSISKLNGLTAR